MEETRTTTMDELELTRRALDDVEVDAAALDRVRSRLRTEIRKERSRRRGRWILATAAVLVAVVVAIGVVGLTPREVAASELRRLADIAEDRQPVRQGPNRYLLIRSEELRRESSSTIGVDGLLVFNTRLHVSTWVAQDRSGFRREEVLSSVIADADRQAWLEAGRPELDLPRTHEYPPGEVPIPDVSQWPTDPEVLLRALRSGELVDRPPGDDQVFILIGEILSQDVAAPKLQAALFECAARLDGVVLVGRAEDQLGRSGTAVELSSPGSRTRLVFDPDSAHLLAMELYEPDAAGRMDLQSWIAPQPTVVVDDVPAPPG